MSKRPEWLDDPSLKQLFVATRAAGGEARAVGGCVRDWLMGREEGDVDIASSLPPEKTMALAAQHRWKAIPTGIEHGTVTLVLPSRVVEVTTLRRDVTTDGRHAVVAFTDDWREDAGRRDFTINAMSMDDAGNLHDYFNGQQDIAGHRVAFIGDAATRIAEDALRILRYFRFLASHGKPPADAAALAAIAEKKDMISALSGERIANEMRKLLAVANPAYALRLMKDAGIAPLIFGREIEPQTIIRLHMLEVQADYQCSVWARALLLVPKATQEDAKWLSERWKLARHEAQQLKLLVSLPAFDASAPRHFHTRLIRLHGAPAYLDWVLVQAATMTGIDIAPYVHLAHDFTIPVCPVTAKDLMATGMKEGKALGDALAVIEQRWEESDYTLTKLDLLGNIRSH
jgi:tRNA nucleotidyltransferase/poly(A) polymerase